MLKQLAGRLKRFKDRVLDEAQRRQASQGDAERMVRLAIELSGRRGANRTVLAHEMSLPPARVEALVTPLEASGAVVPAVGRWLDAGVPGKTAREILSPEQFEFMAKRIEYGRQRARTAKPAADGQGAFGLFRAFILVPLTFL